MGNENQNPGGQQGGQHKPGQQQQEPGRQGQQGGQQGGQGGSRQGGQQNQR